MQAEILNANGQPLRHVLHNNQMYVEVPPSGEYSIRLTNNSPQRKMAVLSVDGINAISGDTAGFTGQGYVLDAWNSITVKGFLRSNSECARFTFGRVENSYSAQTGRGTSNVGVIGVAVFGEKVRRVTRSMPGSRPGTSVTSSAGVEATKDLGVGTEYGHAEAFFTAPTTFEKASETPEQILTLRYAVREMLVRWGVLLDAPVDPVAPNPFPAQPGFAPAPLGWKG